jgi:estrone sulfotransferase
MKINSIFTFREYLSLELGHRLVKSRPDDQYLVSYPRSGNTWMRTMLSVLVNPAAEGNPDFTRQNIPGISISNSKKINALSSPRLIKSHTWFREEIPRALYLVRDGRDVLISLYHYYITRDKKDLSFSAFYQEYLNGKYGQLWHENVESWLINGRELLGENLLVITFEQLKADTFQTLTRSAEFLNLQISSSEVEKALEISNINKMRKIEMERRGPIENINASFYRGGKTGEWVSYFDPTIEKKFMASAGKALRLAGYH